MRRYFTILVTILPSNHSQTNLHNSKFVATAACSANFILYTLFRQQMYTKACFAQKYVQHATYAQQKVKCWTKQTTLVV